MLNQRKKQACLVLFLLVCLFSTPLTTQAKIEVWKWEDTIIGLGTSTLGTKGYIDTCVITSPMVFEELHANSFELYLYCTDFDDAKRREFEFQGARLTRAEMLALKKDPNLQVGNVLTVYFHRSQVKGALNILETYEYLTTLETLKKERQATKAANSNQPTASAEDTTNEPMRDKTIYDLMEEIMISRNAKWAKEKMGKPHEVIKLAQGHKLWRWVAKYGEAQEKSCTQDFYLDSAEKIIGWNHTCPDGKYGQISRASPKPSPKIPPKSILGDVTP